MRRKTNITEDDFELYKNLLLSSFLIMSDYNGISDYFKEWYDLEPKDGRIDCPLNFTDGNDLVFVWGVLVCMFGEYGTSPRFGWITDVYYFKIFLKKCIAFINLKEEEEL